MDQSYSLFTLIFKGVHEPFGFDSLLLLTFLRSSRMFRISGFILDGVYLPCFLIEKTKNVYSHLCADFEFRIFSYA